MLSPLLSNLSDPDRISYIANEKQIADVEEALLSSSEVMRDLEEKLNEVRLRMSDQTKTLHALYASRQLSYNKVFCNLKIIPPKPKVLFHCLKKEDILRNCNFEKKVWGSTQFFKNLAIVCPVYEETKEGTKQVSLQDAIAYWQHNLNKIVLSE